MTGRAPQDVDAVFTGGAWAAEPSGYDALTGDDVPSRPRVLVADDSEVVREALGQLLRRCGYDVEAVPDGLEAIRRLQSTKVDALLLDLQMPGHDGFETLEYVQVHRRGLPTMLMSGLPADEIQGRMGRLSSGQLPPLFLKPCDYEQVLDMLDLMLAGDLPVRVE